ncbi:MAG: nucleotidyltransferase domain-containing protein [bacterium]
MPLKNIMMAESLMREILDKINKIAQKHRVKRVILFGSFSRKTQSKKSDLDLIFIKETKKRFLERTETLWGDLSQGINLPIEVLVYTPKEFNRMIKNNNPFIKRILKEGKIIYEQRKPER